MAAKGTGAKRSAVERDADRLLILELRLKRLAPSEILQRLNDVQTERARRAAIARGMPPAKAEAFAQEARLSYQSMTNDFKAVRQGLRAGALAAQEHVVLERLAELELERLALLNRESEMWDRFEASDGEETVVTHEHMTVVQDGAGGPPKLEAREVVRRKSTNRAEVAYVAQAARFCELRLDVMRQMFELRCLLAAPPPSPIDFSQLGDRQDALQGVVLRELEWLYRVEARAQGKPVDQQRLRLLQSMMQQRTPGRGNGHTATPPGAPRTHEFRLRLLEAGQPLEGGSDGDE